MSAENKAVARRFYESISAGRLEVIDTVVAEDFVEHEEFPGLSSGRDGVRQFFELMRTTFSDFTMTIEGIVSEGDDVVIRATMTGTQKTEFMGIPASGKQMKVPFADFVRFRDGKVVEHWGATDTGAMMEQLKGSRSACCLIRIGGYGDAVWADSAAALSWTRFPARIPAIERFPS